MRSATSLSTCPDSTRRSRTDEGGSTAPRSQRSGSWRGVMDLRAGIERRARNWRERTWLDEYCQSWSLRHSRRSRSAPVGSRTTPDPGRARQLRQQKRPATAASSPPCRTHRRVLGGGYPEPPRRLANRGVPRSASGYQGLSHRPTTSPTCIRGHAVFLTRVVRISNLTPTQEICHLTRCTCTSQLMAAETVPTAPKCPNRFRTVRR